MIRDNTLIKKKDAKGLWNQYQMKSILKQLTFSLLRPKVAEKNNILKQ
jgi:hypothetical protein